MIKLQTYSINKLVLTNEVLEAYINNFWNDIFSTVTDGGKKEKHFLLMCKVEFNETELGYRTLGDLRRVNFDDKELFIEYLQERLGILTEAYTVHPIYKITFSYVIKEGLATDNRRLLQDVTSKSLTSHRFYNLNLPISMNPSDYGTIRGTTLFDTFTRYFVTSGTKTFEIDVQLDGLVNKVTILGAIDLSWIDTKLSNNVDDSYTFKREIKKSNIYFIDGEVVLRKQQQKFKPFKSLKVDPVIVNDFYTMDIETIKQSNGKLKPYLICAHDGQDYITSYNSDPKLMFSSFFEQLISKIEPGLTIIYAHNMSSFDGLFFMKHLFELGEVTPLIDDTRIISIKVKIGDKKSGMKTIVFKDSYLMWPLSLRYLCSTFNVVMAKTYFPFKLMNIFYTGVFPKFEYWTGITLSEYELLKLPFKNNILGFQKISH